MKTLEHQAGWAGADEAGRGPLAGPVVAAAVMLPADFCVTGIADSKQLKPEQRDIQFERIKAHAHYRIIAISPEEIDRINILQASLKAMHQAVCELGVEPERVFVDGNKVPAGMPYPTEAVVKGDGKLACIAAASILAKVTRDRLMVAMDSEFPGYGFARNFGYPTPDHFEALRRVGPCSIHRRSFAPVRELIDPPLQLCLIANE